MPGPRHRLRLIAIAAVASLAVTLGVSTLTEQPALAAGETVVSLTFDDANADQLPAAATLAGKGLAGTFFINSGFLNQPGYLTTAELASLASAGHEIGGHTRSHPDLTAVPTDEATRQICNDRVSLTELGYSVRSFAYPFAAATPAIEALAAACGYNSARGLGDLRTAPGTPCADCPPAETIPPANPFWTRAADQIDASWTLARLQSTVTDAAVEGGWVQLTFHHVCDGCDELALSPAVFDQFTTWLAGWADGVNTQVRTVGDVVGGAVQPAVPGPAFTPPPAAGPGVNALQNPGFEELTADGIPRCWWDSVFGINQAVFSTVSPGRTGANASHIAVTGYSTGDAKRLQLFDGGACAPTVVAGQTYSLRAWYTSTGLTQFTVYYRLGDGSWIYGTSSEWFAAASGYTPAVWTTPAIPAGVNGLSFALNVFGNGELTVDDYSMYNTVGAPLLELATAVPVIIGSAAVGSPLTASVGTWGPAPVALAYQWSVGGTAVARATGDSYTPVAADAGKTVTVTVTGTKTGYASTNKTSLPTAAVARATLSGSVPSISGTARVGVELTATAGSWAPAPVALGYQWSVGGAPVTGATSARYTPVAGDAGKTVTVTVTGTKTGYATDSKTSPATAPVARATLTSSVPTISGTPRVGSTLTAATGTWGPAPVTLGYQWRADGVDIADATNKQFTPGTREVAKKISVRVTGSKAGYTSVTRGSASTAPVAALPGARLAGADRYETSARISAATFKAGVGVVYIATGENFPDALSGGAAAGAGAGPVLLVSPSGIPTAIRTELLRLKPGRIVVLGSTAAVSATVEKALAAIAPTRRIGGADRFATSALISAATFPSGVPVAYVATGTNFPDALSGGPAAGRNKGPVLIVTHDTIPEPVRAELARLKPKKIVLLGASNAVSEAVARALGSLSPTSRIAGEDRFETSALLSKSAFSAGVPVAYLTTGENFPDALSGSAAAIAGGGPVLLVRQSSIPAATIAELNRLRPQRIIVLGGPDAVSDAVMAEAQKFAK